MIHATSQTGVPVFIGDAQAGNHHDLFAILTQFKQLISWCVGVGIPLKGVVVNMDKGVDSKALRQFCFRHGPVPNVKENVRKRKKPKRGRKRKFEEETYKNRFVCERTWAWFDSFRTLSIRFETSICNWKSWHFFAAFMMVPKA